MKFKTFICKQDFIDWVQPLVLNETYWLCKPEVGHSKLFSTQEKHDNKMVDVLIVGYYTCSECVGASCGAYGIHDYSALKNFG